MRDDEDQTTAIIAQYTLDVNDALLTRTIIKYLGNRVILHINHNNSLKYIFPNSTCDLIVHGDGQWAPVTGAFADNGHLYLLVGFGTQGEFLYSPTAKPEWRSVPHGYEEDEDGTVHEFWVNPLLDGCIAKILPLEDEYYENPLMQSF